jgi:hypothetical protein
MTLPSRTHQLGNEPVSLHIPSSVDLLARDFGGPEPVTIEAFLLVEPTISAADQNGGQPGDHTIDGTVSTDGSGSAPVTVNLTVRQPVGLDVRPDRAPPRGLDR